MNPVLYAALAMLAVTMFTALVGGGIAVTASGAPIDEIADRAALSPGTVRNYLSNAMAKLNAANRHEACAIARRLGWI